MKLAIRESTLDELIELEREMVSQGRTSAAEALRVAVAALAKPVRGWISTGEAAERLGISIPTVKAWISRGALTGRRVGDRWWVSDQSVREVLGFGDGIAALEEERIPTEEEALELTRRVRHQMAEEKSASARRAR